MKNILVPTDFSTEAGYALKAAVALAQPANAKICLMHVLQSLYAKEYNAAVALPDEGWQQLQKRVQQAEKQLQDMLREHHVTYGQIIPYVKVGSVFEDVSSIIARSEADLIVMGTKGATGLYELLVGSNAEKVVRYARSPVIAVPRGDVGHFGLRNVVFATDFDDRAESLLLLLTGWQRVFRFKLHLLYVNTPGQYATTAKIEDRIGKFLKKYPGPQYTTAIVDEYSVRDGIRVYAAKVNADLVAMLTHGRDGLAHFLGGSLTEDAVNHLPTPVLTYNIHTHEQYCL